MLTVLLITVPLLLGLVSFFIRDDFKRRVLIVVCSSAHLVLTGLVWGNGDGVNPGAWFAFDHTGVVFLAITSLLFFGASFYGIEYLSGENHHEDNKDEKRRLFSREAVFSGCFLLFLSTMTFVVASQHLAVLWVGIEATTLASAPLIYFHRTKRSLEATWKYLLICSVGIAVALLGVFFLAVADHHREEMLLGQMIASARDINVPWLKAAFLLLFVGYGTKMGLAPFHTWLPDAHSEAPSVVSALLSGALLNCAFLGILRGYQICIAAGLQSYCQEIFIVFGLVSMAFAAVFILGQTDYKRMLAYSSVEHMGMIIFGIGVGESAVFGALVNMLGHSLTKAGLFFVAGNILSYFGTKRIADIQGILTGKMRWSGALWMTGFLLITGTPPSGIFLGKFIILKETLFQGRNGLAVVFLATLGVIFIGMARIFIMMTLGGTAPQGNQDNFYNRNTFLRIWVPALFFVLVITLGVYFPYWLKSALGEVAHELGGG
ncbi:MAG TPA: proton-conducting transporter membrane subunit [Candidatus Omnitrophota bacterium]|nr:proton-conducting transporter membrane subunit [Candidatus Omnitrophota bacterium]HPN55785.1 proton-conducting transporter membrane subunit [Candidatus Omnitrophota bacterium]